MEGRRICLLGSLETPMRLRFRSLQFLVVLALFSLPLLAQAPAETITIDADAPTHPFPHFWEQMFGSGRAILSLRDSYRRDLRWVYQITGFHYVRFHAILDDDMGIYSEDKQGRPIYNFSYVDQIYDSLLANDVKPFVEFSFMPYQLAARQDLQSFWYRPNVSPPKDYAKWDAMIKHATQTHVPLDFVSSHVYGNDKAADVFHTSENIPRDQMVCRAVKKVHDEIKASALPDLPLIWSEFNAAYDNHVEVTDSIYMGPWLAATISQCDGLTQMMSYWTFSDVFEEQGVVKEPFYGGFGVIAAGGIPKPSFYALQVLHRLGDRRIENNSQGVLVTKTSAGALVIALWNIVNPGSTGAPRTVKLDIKGVEPNSGVRVSRVDAEHGNTLALYEKMGKPRYPTQNQIRELREQSQLPDPEYGELSDGSLTLQLPVNGLAVLQVIKTGGH